MHLYNCTFHAALLPFSNSPSLSQLLLHYCRMKGAPISPIIVAESHKTLTNPLGAS